MNQTQVEAFVSSLENVQREENFGYAFFFVGEDHRVPFISISDSDNDYDTVSNLNREGVFRLNIGVGRETFKALLGDYDPAAIDYSLLNTFLPHPEYAKQHFVCILNPSGDNVETTKKLIVEAHDLAASRLQRRSGSE
ncbi:MAG: hypothetical protein KF726_18180 [Anaerolineae bacterium]|nr:hypothetical protein [Anaerolineae bacterium]